MSSRRDLFLSIREQSRQQYGFAVFGYVAMPEHFHLLLSEPKRGNVSAVMQVVNQRVARRVLKDIRGARVPGPLRRALLPRLTTLPVAGAKGRK